MDREQILAGSRRENEGIDERERAALEKAGRMAAQVGLGLCCMIAVLEICLTGKINMGSWTIYFGILGTQFFVKFAKLRQKHELAVGIVYGVLFLFFLAWFVWGLFH